MQELSQWFNLSEQIPWQVGVYKTEDSDGEEYFNYWDGKSFHWGVCENDEVPMDDPMDSPFTWTVKWRGLSSGPSKPAPSPKPRGNRRVTRYVVMAQHKVTMAASCDGSFESKQNAEARMEQTLKICGDTHSMWIQKIRFRTPEASQSTEEMK